VRGLVALLLLIFATPALADSAMPDAQYANTQLSDPAKEAKARELMLTLRCLVCQGQSIADSDADMAGDMRALVRRKIDAGESPEEIRIWLIERYGDWVSYDPVFNRLTAILWIAPLFFIALGLFVARGRFRKKAK
jgi:cytochrome c-type biogenesis protein CcmH